jgi:hypothetical protein
MAAVSISEVATLLTALAVVIGALWTVVSGRRQTSANAASNLWEEAMDVVETLKAENARLLAENLRLREQLANRGRNRRPAQPIPNAIQNLRARKSKDNDV